MCVLGGANWHPTTPLNIRYYIKIKIYTFNITINVIGLGRYKSIFGSISKTTPLSEHAIWKCTPYSNFLFILNFTSLTLVLRRENPQYGFRPGAQKHALNG